MLKNFNIRRIGLEEIIEIIPHDIHASNMTK